MVWSCFVSVNLKVITRGEASSGNALQECRCLEARRGQAAPEAVEPGRERRPSEQVLGSC